MAFGGLFPVFRGSPVSLCSWGAIVRVGNHRSGWRVPEPALEASVVPGGSESSAPGSVASLTPSVCRADAWHVGPLRKHLQGQKSQSDTGKN